MGESTYAPNDPVNPSDDDERWTIEVQMTGITQRDNGKEMAEGILTLRSPEGEEHQFDFVSGGYGNYPDSWLPGLDRDNCELVHYDFNWDSYAYELRMDNEGFNGPDGRGSWVQLVSPRHFTERGGSKLGGENSGYFGIHTDGRDPGSLGCIALEDGDSEELFAILDNLRTNHPEQIPLRVNVLPPQRNFAPAGNIDPEVFPGLTMQQIGGIQRMECESRLREEFTQIQNVENTVFDDFTMTSNRAASLLFLDQQNGINRQTMLGIWDMNSDKGNPNRLSDGDSNWGMSDTQFATALLRHDPEIYENVDEFLENSDIRHEAADVRAYSVALRNYMAQQTGMAIPQDIALDSARADEYFAGLEVPEDMFTDPEKIAFFENENNFRRYHDDPNSARVSRLVENDGVTSEQDHTARFRLLSDLPFAEASAMRASLLATAEQTGLDPMSPFTAGQLYAAYTEGESGPDSEAALSTQRHVEMNAYTGMGMVLPLVTDSLQNNVQQDMQENPESNPYDRIQATFIGAGMYDTVNDIREIANAPLAPRPVQIAELSDVLGSGPPLPDISVDLMDGVETGNPQPRQARFDL